MAGFRHLARAAEGREGHDVRPDRVAQGHEPALLEPRVQLHLPRRLDFDHESRFDFDHESLVWFI